MARLEVEVRFRFTDPEGAPWVSLIIRRGMELKGAEVYYPHDYVLIDRLLLGLPEAWRASLRSFLARALPAIARELKWAEDHEG